MIEKIDQSGLTSRILSVNISMGQFVPASYLDGVPEMTKSIYERIAVTELKHSVQLTEGTAPHRTFIAQFHYANGLVVNYNGKENGWTVVRNEE